MDTWQSTDVLNCGRGEPSEPATVGLVGLFNNSFSSSPACGTVGWDQPLNRGAAGSEKDTSKPCGTCLQSPHKHIDG